MGTAERIKELEEQLSTTKYNKATEHAFGVMKAQLAKLRDKQEARAAKKTGGKGFFVKKAGNATVVLLGYPSVGKSSLLNIITSAESPVGSFAFTTLTVIPGTLEHKQAQIQILDVPGIVAGAASGKGRGKEVLAMVRNADLILILLEALHPKHLPILKQEIYDVGVRLNQEPPVIRIKKKSRGGVSIASTVRKNLDPETIKAILREFRIGNADVVIRSKITIDQFIDALEANKSYIPSITVVNKIDMVNDATRKKLIRTLKPDVMVSAETHENMEQLKDAIFDALNFVRIYMKEIGKKPDMEEPLVLKSGVTVRDVVASIHRDFVNKFRFARLWGPSAKFDGQMFKKMDKKLQDGDIVEVHVW